MKEFTFKLYWSQNEITFFTIESLSENDARRELRQFLGQDIFKIAIELI